jgi:hypothetical protein
MQMFAQSDGREKKLSKCGSDGGLKRRFKVWEGYLITASTLFNCPGPHSIMYIFFSFVSS